MAVNRPEGKRSTVLLAVKRGVQLSLLEVKYSFGYKF